MLTQHCRPSLKSGQNIQHASGIKVCGPISVCDPLWTHKIKGVLNMKHMIHGLQQHKNQVKAQHV